MTGTDVQARAMSEGNGNTAAKLFLGRALASFTAMIPALGVCLALGMSYVKGETRKEWEPALAIEKAERKVEIDEKISSVKEQLQDLKRDLGRIERKLDDVILRSTK